MGGYRGCLRPHTALRLEHSTRFVGRARICRRQTLQVTRARRTASADWWITPGTAGMRPRDLFTTSRDYQESVEVIFH
ncbi:hypothetical protein EVAR_34385_1 [Eumeta japonica]|uniref:Uncharacterized protein n=1 Tax=Eumeta variegata TaxID=151549 RepID=A0A4C1WW33_EUMVA|nr:hypothetical protein EVAR_34385_1 [Eumeta japonica]